MRRKLQHKGYFLNFYPTCEQYPNHDNRYQLSKSRPYDNTEYYSAYTYDKENWIIHYKGKVVTKMVGTFEEIVDYVEDKNSNIKPKICHY